MLLNLTQESFQNKEEELLIELPPSSSIPRIKNDSCRYWLYDYATTFSYLSINQ